MYHPHANEVEQIDNGLYGLLIIDPQTPDPTHFDKDFSMVLGAWNLPNAAASQTAVHSDMPGAGAAAPAAGAMGSSDMSMMQDLVAAGPSDSRVQQMAQSMGITAEQAVAMMQRMLAAQPMTPVTPGAAGMSMPMGSTSSTKPTTGGMNMDYNYFTINGKAYPATEPWAVQQGDLVRVRIVNISNLVHPMHLHGQDFKIIAKDGEPRKVQEVENTLTVNPGETYDIVFRADSPGTWLLHCHELHHVENNGVEPGGLIQAVVVQGATPAGAMPAASPTSGGTQPANAPTATPSQQMPTDDMPGMGH
jgi:FtsP/CotA-like multicopper oxidase with cupredoxin domain